MIPFTSLCPGAQIALLSGILGLLTAAMVCLFIPDRWFRGRGVERLLCLISLWLWLSIGWALLFAWPFIERGLVE